MVATCVAAVLAGSAASHGHAALTVRVVARDASFTISRRSAPAGSTVRFLVRNEGRTAKRFSINGRRTRVLGRGKAQALAVRFPRRGTYPFRFTVGKRVPKGLRGAFTVVAPAPAPPPPEPTSAEVVAAANLTQVGTFERPVLVTAPAGDDRVFVVEQTGAVRIVQNGQVLERPFLDVRGRVTAMGESGLLSIAFAPDYAQSGLVYAFYNSREGPYGDIRISEFRRDAANPDALDPATERVVLTIPKPYENHNGGMLQFGPDGYLYASVGDGDPGAVNRAGYFAQTLDDLLGNIVRIDPRNGDPYAIPADNPFVGRAVDARGEIWAYGLRNPWRFWIDHQTRRMFIGDAGATTREEVDLVALDRPGANFGWPCLEGTLLFDGSATCPEPLVGPLFDFPRDNGVCVVIGGVVARDPRIQALSGRYLYGDLCAGTITVVGIDGTRVTRSDVLDVKVPLLSSFGVDGVGRVYAMSAQGPVYRLDPR
jgi:glucose/arabinose dehydrogenase